MLNKNAASPNIAFVSRKQELLALPVVAVRPAVNKSLTADPRESTSGKALAQAVHPANQK